MPRMTRSTPSKKTKKPPRQAKPAAGGSLIQMSHEEPLLQSLNIVIHGKLGVGKSSLAATASQYFPKSGWPTVRHKGKPKYILKDMVWISIDRKATAGFRERGIGVPQIDVPFLMTNEQTWRGARFASPPNIFQAVEYALNEAARYSPDWIVMDTVSALDRYLETYYTVNTPRSNEGKSITIQKYGKILADHKQLYEAAMGIGAAAIFCCHSKAAMSIDETKDAKARKEVMATADGGLVMPDITGKGQLAYKGDASMQLAMIAKKAPGRGGLIRSVSPIQTDDHETKNRWELSLDKVEEAHLGKILKKIAA